ncbi:MAG: arylsulfatase [Acidimicrobiia bacterium]
MAWQGERFEGQVGLTTSASVPSWPARPQPPEGAPNVLLIVLDDVGFGHLGCYGSRIDTPNIDRVADEGLRFRNFYTTAMCSPTRSCLLTGRNHHTNGLGNITESASGFPGYNGHIPRSSGFVSRVLQQHGYASFAVGKWHLCSPVATSAAGPFDDWPLGRGFDRFYGFLGGETSQFEPELVSDNHRVERPEGDGYHLSDDLARAGLRFLRDLRSVDTDKPWFMYWNPGACHAPHQAPPEFIDRYRNRFDDGWDAVRAETLERQIEFGVLPEGTRLSERPDVVEAWADLSDSQRQLYARQMEVFAGFLTHTDAAIGALLQGIESLGELDDTMVIVVSDNGASGEGQDHGTFNENLMFNGIPADLETNLAHAEHWGSEDSFAHYAHGWCHAGNTPFQKWKRTTYRGGIADPLIVRYPKLIEHPGRIRHQFTHAIDVAATLLDVVGIDMPNHVDGIPQTEVAGRSFASALGDPDASEHRTHQYFEMYGNRAMYADGWIAVSFHPMPGMPSDGAGDPNDPELDMPWELYDLRTDPSQSRDVAPDHPEIVRDLERLWFAEAGKYDVFPVNSHTLPGLAPRPGADRKVFTYWPDTSMIPNDAAPKTLQRPFRIDARFDLPSLDTAGVLIAQGGRFGGWTVYVKDAKVHYEYNYLGLERFRGTAGPLGEGPHHLVVDVALADAFEIAPALTALGLDARGGTVSMRLDDLEATTVDVEKMIPFNYSLTGEGLCCGFDSESGVSTDYDAPFTYTGTIDQVVIALDGEDVPMHPAKARERAWLVQ